MKTILCLLFVIPGFCFAQTENNKETPKPAADDCPSWNKKGKSSSKAEYFQYLRSPKSIRNQQQTAVYYPGLQRTSPGPGTQAQRTTQQNLFYIPRRDRQAMQTAPPATTAASTPAPAKKSKPARQVPVKKEEINTETKPQEIATPKEEPAVAANNANEGKKEVPVQVKETSTDSKTTIKERPKTENKLKKWFHRSSTKKTKACKLGDASKCPSF